MIWLVETNTLIYALNNQGGVRERVNGAALRGRVVTSTVTVAELLYGAERSTRCEENRRRVYTGIANLEVLPFTMTAAAHFGRLKAHLKGKGKPRSTADLMLAATAIDIGATLVTHDIDLLSGLIPGLSTEDWYR